MKHLGLFLFLWLVSSQAAQAAELTPITSFSFVGAGAGFSQSFYLPSGVARFEFETSGPIAGAMLYHADDAAMAVGMVALCTGNCRQAQYLTIPRSKLYKLKVDVLGMTDWQVTVTNLDGLLAVPALPLGKWSGKGNEIVPGRVELQAGQRYKLTADYSLTYGDLDFFVSVLDSRGQIVASIYAMPEGQQLHEIDFVASGNGPVWVNVLASCQWRVGIVRAV